MPWGHAAQVRLPMVPADNIHPLAHLNLPCLVAPLQRLVGAAALVGHWHISAHYIGTFSAHCIGGLLYELARGFKPGLCYNTLIIEIRYSHYRASIPLL